ncbi:hypothetical protein JCM19294_1497 [Nonlabens tegetincola]|uniref:DUF2141 domain-containing protein n=1 Tax=Nonlabens tegetincola TaxID=323273 RepID=A0A090QPP8_9FLAO|nr:MULTISPECIES: DUF2141 domain-containing protein [Nonlabens]GAK97451.1 hypothetical protein JCM19294_1497 [Nonlabens tegetincola]
MKTIITSILLALVSLTINAQEEKTFTLTVTVNNASTDDGKMVYALNTAETWNKKPYQSTSIEIKDGKAIATFENIPQGEYAVTVLHDKNNNQRMDFADNGMPTEAYGLSNNPMSYGPPQWSEAKFEISENKEIIVRL